MQPLNTGSFITGGDGQQAHTSPKNNTLKILIAECLEGRYPNEEEKKMEKGFLLAETLASLAGLTEVMVLAPEKPQGPPAVPAGGQRWSSKRCLPDLIVPHRPRDESARTMMEGGPVALIFFWCFFL